MDAVAITGQHPLYDDKCLFGAKRPPWLTDWLPVLERIEQILKEGHPVPYLLIAKLGYEIIIFYKEQARESVRFSYAQEVFQIVANKIVSAAPGGPEQDNVHEFMSAFGPLITSACGAPPRFIVVLGSEEPTHFGIETPNDSTSVKVDVDDNALDKIKEQVYIQIENEFPASIQRALGAQPPQHDPISFF